MKQLPEERSMNGRKVRRRSGAFGIVAFVLLVIAFPFYYPLISTFAKKVRSAVKTSARNLSRKDKMDLSLEYELNQRHRDLGIREIATGVYCMEKGKGITRSNVYFVRSGSAWVLIDTASQNCGRSIQKAAESLFGANTRPASILLTHSHTDHAGSALELARMWGLPVYMHPDELPLATPDLSIVQKYANPLDRWVVLPLLRVMPPQALQSMFAKASLKDIARTFDPGADVPDLPDWECIPTPGHTPGHVAFFRNSDRVLIAGDAVLTVDLNSLWGFLLWSFRRSKQRIGTIYISTCDWQAAKRSILTLAQLEPRVLACGHGIPMADARTAHELHTFAAHFVAQPQESM